MYTPLSSLCIYTLHKTEWTALRCTVASSSEHHLTRQIAGKASQLLGFHKDLLTVYVLHSAPSVFVFPHWVDNGCICFCSWAAAANKEGCCITACYVWLQRRAGTLDKWGRFGVKKVRGEKKKGDVMRPVATCCGSRHDRVDLLYCCLLCSIFAQLDFCSTK